MLSGWGMDLTPAREERARCRYLSREMPIRVSAAVLCCIEEVVVGLITVSDSDLSQITLPTALWNGKRGTDLSQLALGVFAERVGFAIGKSAILTMRNGSNYNEAQKLAKEKNYLLSPQCVELFTWRDFRPTMLSKVILPEDEQKREAYQGMAILRVDENGCQNVTYVYSCYDLYSDKSIHLIDFKNANGLPQVLSLSELMAKKDDCSPAVKAVADLMGNLDIYRRAIYENNCQLPTVYGFGSIAAAF